MNVLIDIYKNLLSNFILKEIELGKPKPIDHLEDSEDKISFQYDLFDKETDRK